MEIILRHAGAVIGAVYLGVVLFFPCKNCENPAVMAKAKGTVEDVNLIPFTVIKKGGFSFYGVDDLLDDQTNRDDLKHNEVFLAKDKNSFLDLWSKHVDRDGWWPMPKLTKDQWVFFIFGGVQDDDSCHPQLELEEIEFHAPVDAPRMAWFGLVQSEPRKLPGNERARFTSPYLVVSVDKKYLEKIPDNELTFFFESIKGRWRVTILVKVQVFETKEQ